MPTTIDGTNGVSQVQNGVVTPAKTQVGALPSMVRLNTANGYGSTNTKIRRFTNIITNQGSDITYADSATLGASFTINTNGIYAITYNDSFTTANEAGLSLNTTTPTTNIVNCAASEILAVNDSGGNAYATTTSWVGYLPASSVVRAHGSTGITSGVPNVCQFTIVRVA